MFKRLLIGLIHAYQKTLSPDHGALKDLYPYGYCRHEPTCSQYAKEQVENRGAMIGSFLGFKRVLSCHPWAPVSDEKMRKLAAKLN